MTAHVGDGAFEDVGCVMRMERMRLRVLCAGEVVDVVELDGLVDESNAHHKDRERDEEKRPPQQPSMVHSQWPWRRYSKRSKFRRGS